MGIWLRTMESLGVAVQQEEATFVRRTTCRVCSSDRLELILDYGDMPLAGGFFPADDARSKRLFPMHLMRCVDCTLMQVAETVNPSLIFSTYSYSSSVNRTLVAHNTALANQLYPIAGPNRLIVEIGCNDGVLLNPLTALGATVVGVDPSDVARKASERGGWPLVQGYFDADAARAVQTEFGPAEVIVANNVCAHMDDPNVLFEGVAHLLSPTGRFVFEVHYQGDLLATRQYDTVYHEHTCYFSLQSLKHLLSAHGMSVHDVERIPIHGGSIRVTAVPSGAMNAPTRNVEAMLAQEQQLDARSFASFAIRHGRVLRDLIGGLSDAGKRVVAYGASGRATILLNFCRLGPDLLEHVSDLSPLRYDRVVPGIGVPILRREVFHRNYPDYALMTAWNYEDEIIADESTFLERGNAFIIPLPEIRLV